MKGKMKKKWIALLLSGCMLCSLGLTGCNGKPAPNNEPKNATLTTSTYTYEAYDVLVGILFNDATLVSVTVDGTTLSADNYVTQNSGLTLKDSYLSTLTEGTHYFTVNTTLNSLPFTLTIPKKVEKGNPVVTPELASVDVGERTEDLLFTIAYNGGLLQSVTLDGTALTDSDYYTIATRLYLKPSCFTKLSLGSHTLEVTTEVGSGSCMFTVANTAITLTDASKTKQIDGSDVTFAFALNGNEITSVSLNGAALPSSAYVWEGDNLVLKNAHFSTLANGFYRIAVKSGESIAYCYLTKGFAPSQVFAIDFDGLRYDQNGYGQDLTNGTETSGIEGTSGKLSTNKSGTIMAVGAGNIAYAFTAGNSYVFSFDIKINSVVEGTSSVADLIIPIWFKTANGNVDLGYIRYTDAQGLYVSKESGSTSFTLTKNGDYYSFSTEFTYQSSYGLMEVPLWMKSDILIDNIVLAPKA